MTQWLSSDEQRLWREFLNFKRDLQLRIDTQLREHGISESDYTVLVVVSDADEGTVRVKEIADATGWESSRLAHQLRRMERRDLIFRMPCKEDARGTLVSLTETGVLLLKSATPGHVEQVRASFIDNLTEEQQQNMLELLEALTANMPTQSGVAGRAAAKAVGVPSEPDRVIDARDATLAAREAAQQGIANAGVETHHYVSASGAARRSQTAAAPSAQGSPATAPSAQGPQGHGGSSGDVQRIDLTAHGNRHNVIGTR